MRRLGWLLGIAAVMAASGADAEGTFVQRRKSVDSGRETRVYNVFNCRTGITSGVSGTAGHGVVTARVGKQRRCGMTEADVMEVYYRPASGYRGPDDVHVYWGRGGRATVHLNVR